jgi:purine-nucleoside phosphorylase
MDSAMTMKRTMKSGSTQLEQIREAVGFIRLKTAWVPEVAIILGTGLGNLTQKVKKECEIAYSDIPHFPVSTVESHAGQMLFGTLSGKKAVIMEGRFHFYEGYSMKEVTFPVHVMKELGAKILIVSNASGGMNLNYRKGEIVVIEDHINFMGDNPLIGPNDERLGPRFPDMCAPYSARLAGLTEEAAREQKISVRRGVYVGVPGPNLETRAEYRMLRAWGADLVGMSTVPEVITAVHRGMEVLGLSIVTDICDPDHLEPCDIKEIIKTANEAGPKLDKLIEAALKKF